MERSHTDNNKTRKCPKVIITLIFYNKGIEQTNLNRILKSDGSSPRKQAKYRPTLIIINETKF